MKTIHILIGVGAIVALLGVNVAQADIKNTSAVQPDFVRDVGDGSSLSPISFDTANNNEAQTTCAMTPGGPSLSQFLTEPIAPLQAAEQLTQYEDLSPISSQGSPSLDPERNVPRVPPYREFPPPPEGDDPPPNVPTPEPATMLIVGLGIGGAAVAARRRWKKNRR